MSEQSRRVFQQNESLGVLPFNLQTGCRRRRSLECLWSSHRWQSGLSGGGETKCEGLSRRDGHNNGFSERDRVSHRESDKIQGKATEEESEVVPPLQDFQSAS